MVDVTDAFGAVEADSGADSADALSAASGFCTVSSPNGIESIAINGITPVVEGSIVPGRDGADLQIDSIIEEPEFSGNWIISYTYSLKENALGEAPAGSEIFGITVTDDNGEAINTSLAVNIADDMLAWYKADDVDGRAGVDFLLAGPESVDGLFLDNAGPDGDSRDVDVVAHGITLQDVSNLVEMSGKLAARGMAVNDGEIDLDVGRRKAEASGDSGDNGNAEHGGLIVTVHEDHGASLVAVKIASDTGSGVI